MIQQQVKRIAIDVNDIYRASSYDTVIRHLLSNGGSLYKTARGRLAILLDKPVFDRIKLAMKLETEETFDGLVTVTIPIKK